METPRQRTTAPSSAPLFAPAGPPGGECKKARHDRAWSQSTGGRVLMNNADAGVTY